MIERFVDYMQFSCFVNEGDFRDNKSDVIAPTKFYKRGYRDGSGCRFYFGNPNSSKALIVMSGQTCQFFRDCGYKDADYIGGWLENGATVSRIDLAVTEWVEEDLITLEDIKKWYVQELVTSSLCKHGCKLVSSLQLDGVEYPETCYIGDLEKRGRLGLFRAYDKGIEMDIGKYLCTRLELEDRGEKADNTANRIALSNDIAGNFRARFDVKSQNFERLMQAPAVNISRGKANVKTEKSIEMESRWNWLIEQVAPALKDAIEHEAKNDPLQTNLSRFLAMSGLADYSSKLADFMVSQQEWVYDLHTDKIKPKTE